MNDLLPFNARPDERFKVSMLADDGGDLKARIEDTQTGEIRLIRRPRLPFDHEGSFQKLVDAVMITMRYSSPEPSSPALPSAV